MPVDKERYIYQEKSKKKKLKYRNIIIAQRWKNKIEKLTPPIL